MIILPPGQGFIVCCGGAMASNFTFISGVVAQKLFFEDFNFAGTETDLLRSIIVMALGFIVGCIVGSHYIKKSERLIEENYTLHIVMVFLEIPFVLLLNAPWILTAKFFGYL